MPVSVTLPVIVSVFDYALVPEALSVSVCGSGSLCQSLVFCLPMHVYGPVSVFA